MSALLRVSRLMLTSSFLQGAVAPAALRVHSTAQQRHASTAAKPKAEVVSKSDLVDMVTEKLVLDKDEKQYPKSRVTEVVNLALALVAAEVAKGNKVQLTGFGTFESRTRAARKGRNPSTGATLDIPEKKYPAFSAGKGFKDTVSGEPK